ncbi:class I SAM-dependent methyltransferase [Echinicola salinicaeni]|uniref:class I SAM-dependent methyltransferase n=1 Tax=Echinicola salinicaeni TaxID=2762757 RepID=UPI0016442B18|nr:class I SAM-dependent methyltransferase [Echinicola salinicaeni]
MKDNFSGHASDYRKFRPAYPDELYEFILSKVSSRSAAWDCGTGNGQVAVKLADYFESVEATDISAQQLALAPQRNNIVYSLRSAEESGFADNSFDLITVAQAVHWFQFEKFFNEVKRSLKSRGIIALIGYGLVQLEGGEKHLGNLYENILGNYWDLERKYIEQNYEGIPFDFGIIRSPELSMEYHWTFDQFMGYLNTWSAVKHYERAHRESPLALVKEQFQELWDNQEKVKLKFPIILRVGVNH